MQIFVLGLAVLLIWSLVAYRFFDLKNPDITPSQQTQLSPIHKASIKSVTPFEYHLNYSEPFAINQIKAPDKALKTNKPLKKKRIPKKIVWPEITFIGIMSSTKVGEKDSYFVDIDQKTETLINQDSIGDLKIVFLTPDSIKLEKDKEQKVYHIVQD